ncbi:12381_t:CDS:1 [Gigaspora margarita]|uniref:12381_t:CDS:1 n=1 Tax=Gigaspora margarita TaxID=4874 RepID=A0ABN7V594_GIGMA|nr:12381_t:CDS:1 [Gigaspora margarita]
MVHVRLIAIEPLQDFMKDFRAQADIVPQNMKLTYGGKKKKSSTLTMKEWNMNATFNETTRIKWSYQYAGRDNHIRFTAIRRVALAWMFLMSVIGMLSKVVSCNY